MLRNRNCPVLFRIHILFGWLVQELLYVLAITRLERKSAAERLHRERAARHMLAHDHKSYTVVTNLKRVLVAPPNPSAPPAALPRHSGAGSLRRQISEGVDEVSEGVAAIQIAPSSSTIERSVLSAVETSEVMPIGVAPVATDYANFLVQDRIGALTTAAASTRGSRRGSEGDDDDDAGVLSSRFYSFAT